VAGHRGGVNQNRTVNLGGRTVEVSIPYYEEMRAALLATMLPEALAYYRGDLQGRWGDCYASTRLNLSFGALVSAPDSVQAQRLRRLALAELAELFTTVDVVVKPTSAKPAALSIGARQPQRPQRRSAPDC
jgi:aspartyl-tRNA(Asn)/glutamyl-tRNA(Gln) amidotransferase subunit A